VLPDGSVATRQGYRTSGYLPPSHFSGTVRSRVGGWHWPLAELFNAVIDAGFQLTRVIEGGRVPCRRCWDSPPSNRERHTLRRRELRAGGAARKKKERRPPGAV